MEIVCNEHKWIAAFDEMNSTFGFYNFTLEKAMEMVDSKTIPSKEDQSILRDGLLRGMAFCEGIDEEELTK